ncbi:unnamed protein product [Strongylus vulgaris]|uniref:Uncharacterized protein n=1 Tax=Strongylus vulgaris TaxID=40348 RepID=A0A3P7JHR4_STRVU|nr:unnamed protein product [Strongylus vulgaris]
MAVTKRLNVLNKEFGEPFGSHQGATLEEESTEARSDCITSREAEEVGVKLHDLPSFVGRIANPVFDY